MWFSSIMLKAYVPGAYRKHIFFLQTLTYMHFISSIIFYLHILESCISDCSRLWPRVVSFFYPCVMFGTRRSFLKWKQVSVVNFCVLPSVSNVFKCCFPYSLSCIIACLISNIFFIIQLVLTLLEMQKCIIVEMCPQCFTWIFYCSYWCIFCFFKCC